MSGLWSVSLPLHPSALLRPPSLPSPLPAMLRVCVCVHLTCWPVTSRMCVPLNMSVCPASLCVHSCEDHESEGPSKVQGQVHEVPVHLGHDGQGEGRETEAVITARWEGRGRGGQTD